MTSSQIRNRRSSALIRCAALSLTVGMLMLPLLFTHDARRAGAQERRPLDLVSDFPDVNGFPYNPKWAWQLTNAGAPDTDMCFDEAGRFLQTCTTHPITYDEPRLPNAATCAVGSRKATKGHINWQPVTYEGKISWGEFAFDGDYCFEFAPPGGNGLTADRPTIHAEFSAAETIRHFNTPWWKDFRKAVGRREVGVEIFKRREREFAKTFLTEKRAVVIGMLNLDCVHKCYTELHPVYALAINIKTERRADGRVDEVWAIFARNWGNMGWCSQNQHYLNLESNSNRLSLLLPWGPDPRVAPGVTEWSYEVLSDHTKFLSNSAQAGGPEISIAGNQGLLLSFNLPQAKDKARVHGELHLRWTMPKSQAAQPPAAGPAAAAAPAPAEPREGEVEERFLFEALGEAGRSRVAAEAEAAEPDAVRQRVTTKSDGGFRRKLYEILDRITGLRRVVIQPEPPAQPPRVESEFDAEKAERDKHLLGTAQNSPR